MPQLPSPFYLLAFLPALVLLIYAYLQRSKLQRVMVGSTFLLEKIRREAKSRKKFRPPWLFWLELLLISLLSLSAAGLYWPREESSLSFLLDNSLSSAARPAKGEKTLFDRIKAEVLFQAEDHEAASFELYVTSPVFQKLNTSSLSMSGLESVLEEIDWEFGSDQLASATTELLKTAPEKAVVLSDKSVKVLKESRLPENISFRQVQLPEASRSNLFVSHAEIIAGRDSVELLVDIGTLGEREGGGRVDLDEWQLVAGEIQKKRVGSKELASSESRIVFSDLLPERLYHVEIFPPATFQDALAEDNHYFAVFSAQAESKGLVVSRQSAEALGVSGMRGNVLRHQYFKDYQINPLDASFYVFHALDPGKLPKKNLLLVSPPSARELGLELKKIEKVEPSRWSPVHPLTRYVRWDLLEFPRALGLSKSYFAEELVGSTEGALLIAGEDDGRKIAVTGFDIFPYSGRDNRALSIFTLNALQWLEAAALLKGSTETADIKSLLTLEGMFSGKEARNVFQPGFLRFEDNSFEARNFIDAGESLLPAEEIFRPGEQSMLKKDSETESSLLKLSLLFVLIYLLFVLATELYVLRKENRIQRRVMDKSGESG